MTAMQTWEVTIPPNQKESGDPAGTYHYFYWLKFHSSTTPGTYSGGPVSRVIDCLANPTWWLGMEMLFESPYPNQDAGVYMNFHNTPVDPAWNFVSTILYQFTGDVQNQWSPDHVNWNNISPGTKVVSLQEKGHWVQLEYGVGGSTKQFLPIPVLDVYYSWVVNVVFGRSGTGSIKTFFQRSDTQPLDANIFTMTGETTLRNDQQYTQLWQGGTYVAANGSTTHKNKTVACRFGQTYNAMIADTAIVKASEGDSGSVYSGTGTNFGNATASRIADRDSSLMTSPPLWSGGVVTPPPPPTPPADFGFGQYIVGPVKGGVSGDYKRGSKYLADKNRTLTAVQVYMEGTGGASTTDTRVSIYADSGGSPGALLRSSGVITIQPTQTPGFVSFSLTSSLVVSAGVNYWIIVHTGPGGAFSIAMDQTTGAFVFGPDLFSDGTTNPFGQIDGTSVTTMTAYVVGNAVAITATEVTANVRPTVTVTANARTSTGEYIGPKAWVPTAQPVISRGAYFAVSPSGSPDPTRPLRWDAAAGKFFLI